MTVQRAFYSTQLFDRRSVKIAFSFNYAERMLRYGSEKLLLFVALTTHSERISITLNVLELLLEVERERHRDN